MGVQQAAEAWGGGIMAEHGEGRIVRQPALFAGVRPDDPPRSGTYAAIYADPPWQERGGGKIKRGADRHYALMATDAIAALPVDRWAAPNAHLYLWVTNNFLPDGLKVMHAWGFRYVTKITWFKVSAEGKPQAGLGQYFRGVTEDCLFGIRGALPYRLTKEGKRAQGLTGFAAPRTEHSVKPTEMRRMIERVSAGPYLELFARRGAAEWDVWGHEAAGRTRDVVSLPCGTESSPEGELSMVAHGTSAISRTTER